MYLFFILFHFGQGIGIDSHFHIGIRNMGVDLGRSQVFMAQHILKGADIHAVIQHQSGRRVAELMGRILGV